jgi:hypothetical protein
MSEPISRRAGRLTRFKHKISSRDKQLATTPPAEQSRQQLNVPDTKIGIGYCRCRIVFMKSKPSQHPNSS